MRNLYDTVIWVGTGFILVSLLYSIKSSKTNKYLYLNRFYIITLITLAISLNAILGFLLRLYGKTIYVSIQNVLFFFDLLFWSHFFLKILKRNRKEVKVIIFISVISVFSLRLYLGFFEKNFQVHALSNLSKLILCLFYINELFKSNLKLDLKRDPAFWIVTGLFFYCAISSPVYAIHSYLILKLNNDLVGNIFASTNIAIIIMHLHFIKACLCSIHPRKAF